MGVWDGIRNQFIEVIEWTEASDDVLSFRFPVANHEIKDGAQLIVRESQVALLVDQGQPADSFEAGQHELTSDNLPILTKLESWAYGFNSPFKSDVYFFSVRQKLGQKWGTRQPITCRDPELGSVQLRMFGVYSYHLADTRKFYREVSGTREQFGTADLVDQLLPLIVSGVTNAFAQAKLPFLDMAANLQSLSSALRAQLEPAFAGLGLALDSFVVESVTLPEALQQALQSRQARAIAGNLQEYAQFEAASAISAAARNPSGIAGLGVGVAAGAGLGKLVGKTITGLPASASPPAPDLVACVACGEGLERGSTFCRFCGQAQRRNCPSCQGAIVPGAAFCSSCGHKLGA
jgi:membrane protease subunit (stomatin/prohibitin family)